MYQPKRVIFTLEDGRDIVDVDSNGEIALWEEEDLDSLFENMQRYGHPCFTADLKHYDVNYEALRRRFPREQLIEVKGIRIRNRSSRSGVQKK